MDTTTIEITKAQKATLDDLKHSNSESYKDVLQMLIGSHSQESDSNLDENDVRNIVTRELEKTFGERLPQ